MLTHLGYLESKGNEYFVIQPEGQLLASIYSEQDLLAAACIRAGIWDDLDPGELAAAVAGLVFESRSADEGGPVMELPAGRKLRDAISEEFEIANDLAQVEAAYKLSFVTEPNIGFSAPAYKWCNGQQLESVLAGTDLAVGDFVRWCRQLLDLLGQITVSAQSPSLRNNARLAADSLRRGIVAYTGVEELDLETDNG